jgi:hypothetical protein
MIELDHLVIAALSLDEGVRWLEQRVGIRADPGVALERFELTVPAATVAALADLGRDRRLAFVEAASPRWTARLRTPSGHVTLG